ncbi:MAG: hypothetical protein AB7L84_12305, partial [Acidimicrobiia bacterium]
MSRRARPAVAPARRLRTPVRFPAAAVAVLVGLAAGCADRPLAPSPEPPPGAATWTAVWVAAVLAALAVAGLVLAAGGRGRPGRPPLAAVVLAVQAGAAWTLLAVGVAVALRGRSLVDQPPGERAATLVRLPAPDGDARLYLLLLAGLVVLVALPAVLLTLGARFARGPAEVDRWLAFAVLSTEVAFGAFGAGTWILDLSRTWPVAVLVANAVPSALAAWAAWPAPPTGTPAGPVEPA